MAPLLVASFKSSSLPLSLQPPSLINKCGAMNWRSATALFFSQQQQQQQQSNTRVNCISSDSITSSSSSSSSDSSSKGITEVDKDSFWRIAEEAGDKLVVVDMYTQWCGPCKMMQPKIIQLSTAYSDVVFVKLDCNQYNKALAKELGIRVVPTFKVMKRKKILGEVTGAKYHDLVELINKFRCC